MRRSSLAQIQATFAVHSGGVGRDREAEPGSVELDVLESGNRKHAGASRRRWRRRPLLVMAGVLLTAIVVAGVQRARTTPSESLPSTGRPTATRSPAPVESPAGAPTAPVVRYVGHPLLGVTAGWELFGRGPDAVVRLQLAIGRITRTSVPSLASTGPVSVVVGSDRVIIRPLDVVPGYVVVDGDRPTGCRPR